MKPEFDIDRRDFLRTGTALVATSLISQSLAQNPGKPIDRHALVSRHNIILRKPDSLGALGIGNGNFAFNADITGLQSFAEYYEGTTPIGILSNWGWHSFPNPNGYTLDKYHFTCYKKRNGQICYPFVDYKGQADENLLPPDARYLRANPHRFGLGRIGLEITKANGSKISIDDLTNVEQNLDLWSGMLSSRFEVEGETVLVETAVHPQRDEVSVHVESRLISSQRLRVRIAFAYAAGIWGPGYEDWGHPERHRTELVRRGANGADFQRRLDATSYMVRASWSPDLSLAEAGPHTYILSSGAGHAGPIELSTWFSPQPVAGNPHPVAVVQSACRQHWSRFWRSGGAIDLSGTEDPRAHELERRIVLSQYVTAVHSSGTLPPQESGLACNTWFGKFHMEMYWWHSAHFALWGRPELLAPSMGELIRVLPVARETARKQGYKGARWQKMIGPEGSESPSPIASMLIWQQPHPIYIAELLYRAYPTRATLERYRDIVFDTADFIASFMDWDPQRKQFVLGAGIASADERHRDLSHNINPTMELGYWRWALETAQPWRERLGLPRNAQWDNVLKNMAPLPVRNGVYPVLESIQEPGASRMATWLDGILPPRGVDPAVMRRTLQEVVKPLIAAPPQGYVMWGNAMLAMCAARLGEPDLALELLIGKQEKNPFMVSGYARGYDNIPVYLPDNGGWLSATAMMAVGWEGAPSHPAPGFPQNWNVRWEGLRPLL